MKQFLITFLTLILCFGSLLARDEGRSLTSAIGSGMSSEIRHIHKRLDIQASLADVWDAWTTVEGVNSFFGNGAKIEMRIGGPYEIYFVMERPKGQRGTEGSKLLAFVPKRMVAFEWGIARQFVEVRKQANQPWKRTWVVVFFRALDEAHTEIDVYHMGLEVGDKWDEVYNFFDRNWNAILKRLNQRFAEVK
jgi:uncharacterized protein YndB with AHSA1/START domain